MKITQNRIMMKTPDSGVRILPLSKSRLWLDFSLGVSLSRLPRFSDTGFSEKKVARSSYKLWPAVLSEKYPVIDHWLRALTNVQ